MPLPRNPPTFESKIDELGEESLSFLRHQAVSGAGGSLRARVYCAVDRCEGLARGIIITPPPTSTGGIDEPTTAFNAFLTFFFPFCAAECRNGSGEAKRFMITISRAG